MRVTIKYSMAVEEGMRRFFFLSSLVSASGNRHVIRSRADSQPGGRSGGAGRGPSPSPARAQPAPLRSAAARLRRRPALRSAPRRPPLPSAGAARPRAQTRSAPLRSSPLRSLARSRPRGRGAEAGASCAAAQLARRRCAKFSPDTACPPVALRPRRPGPAAAAPLGSESGAGGGRSGAPGLARVMGEVPPAAAPVQRRAPRRVRPGYTSRRSGGGWGAAGGGTACARTAGTARRPARRLRGMPAPIPPCVRGCPSAASARRGCAEYPGRQTRRAGTSPVVTPAPGHRCCRCNGGGGVPLCHSCSGVRAARAARCRAPGSQSLCAQSCLSSAAPASSGEHSLVQRERAQVPRVPSLTASVSGLCPAARLPPPPALPAAGLMLPITKLLAEVGMKCFRRGRFAPVRSREQPAGSVAPGSGLRPR